MAKYKGVGIVFIRKLLRAAGKNTEDTFLQRLTPEETQIYVMEVANHWLDYAVMTKLFDHAAQVLYPDRSDRYEQLGYAQAKDNLQGVYRLVAKVLTPEFLNRISAHLWELYNDTGRVLYEFEPQGKFGTFTVHEFPDLPELRRQMIQGYHKAVVELMGGKHVQVTREDSRPDAWKWIMTWE